MAAEPKTLLQALIYFADPKNCRKYAALGERRYLPGRDPGSKVVIAKREEK